MIEKIKLHPWALAGSMMFVLFLIGFPVGGFKLTIFNIVVYLLIAPIMVYCFFNMSVNEEELNTALNNEVERLGYSKEQLISSTGYTHYDITPSEQGGYIFYLETKDKKKLLKELQSRTS